MYDRFQPPKTTVNTLYFASQAFFYDNVYLNVLFIMGFIWMIAKLSLSETKGIIQDANWSQVYRDLETL